ncbi:MULTISPECIES: HNH endonuclease signature motif containing protein [unclassified Mycobacterium]|uniref:HNH endonuclease signature motif containing protein n=1 Tax=unclassified Mycobacterium TaxID=2642494 RepID=UPI0029C6276D|nr:MULTISPECIES: DUF222 domain-containing protein [unclassified Mycobacterium]
MFEESDDAALVTAIGDEARAEAAAAARRLAAIAELTDRRCNSELGEQRQYWACDAFDSVAAEVAAALSIGHRAATGLLRQALALRHRLPKVAVLLAEGVITARIAATLTWRTRLVDDPEVAARVDADLAAAANRFGPMSEAKLEAAVDTLIQRHDPAAVLQYQAAARGRDVGVGDPDDVTGTRSLWGRLLITDSELLERRLEAMVRAVCPADPRTVGERRSDAFGVITAGGDQLPCRCGKADCPAAGSDARASAITITVLTDQHPDPGSSARPDPDPDPIDPGPSDPEPSGEPSATTGASIGIIAGGGVVPTPLLAELVTMGAVVTTAPNPADCGAEPGYRPSRRLQRLVRSRDLTCRFRGCNRPAEYCDLDHTIAYASSRLTHPGNLKCLCRKHHLLKTFWVGAGGWADRQLPDGTIEWTSPTGHQYRVPPGSRIHFPHWDTTTPTPPGSPAGPTTPAPERGLAMPIRKYTRRQQQARAIAAERKRNQAHLDANPPPF